MARKYETGLHRKARCTNHHIFSLRCRNEKVIPVSLRIRPLVRTKQGFEIAERASKAFLNEQVKETHAIRNDVTARLDTTQRRLAMESQLTPADLERVSSLCKEAVGKTFVRTKQTHLQKLERLTSKKRPINLRPEGLEGWSINRNAVRLTKHQEEVLQF